VLLDVLSHFWPKIRSRNLQVSLVSRIVSSEDAVVSFAHGLFPVHRGQVEGRPWVVEIVKPDPHKFVLILK
jgi:hypothetical protein